MIHISNLEEDSFEKKLFPESPELTPYTVIERFETAAKIYSRELVWEDRRFQKAREMYVAAIFMLGYYKLVDKEYWLAPYYGEVPDVFAYKFEPHPVISDSSQKVQMNIEVTEWGGHSAETLHERVINKLKGKAYPPYFVLLVHIRKPGLLNLDAEYDAIKDAGIPLKEAWATGTLAGDDPTFQSLISIGSNKIGVDFSLKEAIIENKKQIPGMLVTEMKKKGTNMYIYPEPYKFEFPTLTD